MCVYTTLYKNTVRKIYFHHFKLKINKTIVFSDFAFFYFYLFFNDKKKDYKQKMFIEIYNFFLLI